MIVAVSIISFLLDGIVSHFISSNSIFLPLFTIVSLVLIYPYFRDNRYRYLKYIAILGLLYDIAYANTVFFHFFIFMILGVLVILWFYFLSNTWYTNLWITIIVIIVYRIVTYLFFVLFQNKIFSFIHLGRGIYSSILLNSIYCLIVYFSTYLYQKKHKISRK